MSKDTYQHQSTPSSEEKSSSSLFDLSESSPLRNEHKNTSSAGRTTNKPRRRSTAEKLAVGIQRVFEAFEFEIVESSSTLSDDDDFSDATSTFDEKRNHGGNGNSSKGKHCCSTWRCRNLSWICICLFFGLSFAFGCWTSRHIITAIKFHIINNEDDGPLVGLKADSFIDGLENGAVAADHQVCSEVGNRILQEGGNAVDAGVATVFCLGVANPASSGLGGGAFILIHSDKANYESRAASMKFPEHHDKRDPDFEEAGNDDEKVTEVIDCREVAPGAATQDMYLSKPDSAPSTGGLSVAVPGELRGLELAHARHGKLPWKDVVAPAIKLAEDGVPVSAHLAHDIVSMGENTTKYGTFPKLRRYLTKNDNWKNPLREGELLRNEKLAKTLRLIAKNGSKVFYEGQLAKEIVEEVSEEGGILTVEDFATYRATIRTPVIGEAFGYKFAGVPPPSSGGATIFGALRFLSGYETPLASDADTLSVHRMAEAMRHAYAIRMSLSDPAFSNVTALAVKDLLSGSYMESLRKITLDNDTLELSLYGGEAWAQLHDTDGQKEAKDAHEGDRRLRQRNRRLARPFGYLDDNGTSHLSVVDKDGNAVAITTSVNQVFGSAVFSEKTGVLLGDTMDDFGNPGAANFFGLKPSPENFIAPGKRPLSSMSPTIVFRKVQGQSEDALGKLALVVGGSGGPKIISAVLQVIINHLFLGMPLFESIARSRVHDQLIYHGSAVTTIEKSMVECGHTIEVPGRTKDALLHRGRESLLDIDYAGTVQAVSIDLETNSLSCASDIRKGGRPAGY